MRFAVHCPAQWLEGSPRCQGRPTPVVDVLGCVYIGVLGVSASRAPEHRLALTALRCHIPTGRAGLRRIRGANLLHPARSPSLAPSWPAVRTAEMVGHRLREVPQRLLLHRLRPCAQPGELGPGFGQLPTLLHTARRRCPTRLPMLVLLYRQVPDKAGMPAVLQQPGFLCWRRQQAIAAHQQQCSRTHRHNRPLTRPHAAGSPHPQRERQRSTGWTPDERGQESI